MLSGIRASEIQIMVVGWGGEADESSFVSLKVSVGFVFCLRALMEESWLGSACDLLPYIPRLSCDREIE